MKVKVDGVGAFDVSEVCLPQLLEFLSKHSAIKIRENSNMLERNDNGFTGRELLND